MKNLFVYGTLMSEEIMLAVSGIKKRGLPAVLERYGRYAIKGERYPAIRPENEESVEGLLFLEIPDPAWRRLDQFEGDMYARKPVDVLLEDGKTASAETYVIQPQFYPCLCTAGWCFDQFLRHHKAGFIREYRGYEALKSGN